MRKTAIITGITGQDGSYLAELLVNKNYHVIGLTRRASTNNLTRLQSVINQIELVEGDVTDGSFIAGLINDNQPDELYHLAAMSHVHASFAQPVYTFDATATSTINCLEAIRKFSPTTRFYFAASSEMFGDNYDEDKLGKYQGENTAFHPRSPYAIAKLAGFHITKLYRDSYNLFTCSGILFNHESPRRGEKFVTQKIVKWIESQWLQQNWIPIRLGNLDAYRDFGYAKEYVEAMWLMLQQSYPDDYLVGTGETYSIRDFLLYALSMVGKDRYIDELVIIDESLFRPCEVPYLKARPKKIYDIGWKHTVNFQELVNIMVFNKVPKPSCYNTNHELEKSLQSSY